MFNLTDFTNFDLKRLDPTRLDLTRFDLRNIELPDFELPAIDTDQLPQFEMPEIDVQVEATRLAEFARDTAYAGVGVVVTTVKKADEQRRELADQVGTRIRRLVDAGS